ncbi:unnamed protein product [Tilletia controversa]|uniref:Fungal STAND N-terminal Goodbye domain-containing protein n=1 Tax=Tilletia caries TaxID=13290 RepID=A0ABN7J1C2_9BASI|nr:unnamed protein product [Tilletia caries]CAD6940234.1 unnamed protein product [Tilletia controversa]CAD6940856.1 unnamed protein product [Tilletia caries]CAD6947488.1 unnamed protein product [Tilletia controversa]CAD6980244.1 unnamed protein product [Tilletia controversa]
MFSFSTAVSAECASRGDRSDAMSEYSSSSSTSVSSSASDSTDSSSSEASDDDDEEETANSNSVTRWYNDVLKLATRRSTGVIDGLRLTRKIMEKANRVGALVGSVELFCVIALRFLFRVARTQSAAGRHARPATACSWLVRTVVSKALKRSHDEVDANGGSDHSRKRHEDDLPCDPTLENIIPKFTETYTDRGSLDFKDQEAYMKLWRDARSRLEEAEQLALGLFQHAAVIAELNTVIVREAFEDSSNFGLRRWLCNSLATLAVLLCQSENHVPAVDDFEEAIRLVRQLDDDPENTKSSSDLVQMATLQLQYACCILVIDRRTPNTTYAKGARAAMKAVSLWRRVNTVNGPEWEGKLVWRAHSICTPDSAIPADVRHTRDRTSSSPKKLSSATGS